MLFAVLTALDSRPGPRICKGQWSKEKDKALLEFVAFCGKKSWMKIGSEFDNRSDF
jgi:hypothetical protein